MNETGPKPGGWPIGVHLRFKLDAALQPQYQSLKGTMVLVLAEPQWTRIPEGGKAYSYRQDVYSYALGRIGAALPSQLEPIPDRRHASKQRSDQRIEE